MVGAEAVRENHEKSNDTHYLLDHTQHELHRLDIQGTLFRPLTKRAFQDAGIGPGMRVLDIGCGGGDVSILVADMVGPEGAVLGIDRGEAAIDAARTSAEARGVRNVTFRVSEIDAFDEPAAFDALVGRFVLMHQPAPASVLRGAAKAVRPGGVVCFLESHMDLLLTGGHSFPHSPLYDELVRWMSAVVEGAGADLHAGVRLRAVFAEAGLPSPIARMEAEITGGADSPFYEYLSLSIRSMQPEATRQGLGGLVDADPDVVVGRLRDEVVRTGGCLIVWPVVAAWCRIP